MDYPTLDIRSLREILEKHSARDAIRHFEKLGYCDSKIKEVFNRCDKDLSRSKETVSLRDSK